MFGGKSMPLVGEKGVQYGLQAPKKATEAPNKSKLSIFGGRDDEEDAANDRNAAIRAQQGLKRSDAKVKKMQAAALQEDAACFEYDAFYDGIQEERKKAELDSFKAEQGGPKYLTSMMAARDHRQRIQDLQFERREATAARADEDLYDGKEQFTTAAYKKKLQEDKLFAEQLAARDAADEDNTVEKQGMDGFLGVIRSAMAAPSSTDDTSVLEAQETAAKAKAAEERRAKAKLEKRLAEMDKYELKRFQLEQKYKQGDAALSGHIEDEHQNEQRQGDGATETMARGEQESARAQKEMQEEAQGVPVASAGARKRAAEDKIAAARERAKQRKAKR